MTTKSITPPSNATKPILDSITYPETAESTFELNIETKAVLLQVAVPVFAMLYAVLQFSVGMSLPVTYEVSVPSFTFGELYIQFLITTLPEAVLLTSPIQDSLPHNVYFTQALASFTLVFIGIGSVYIGSEKLLATDRVLRFTDTDSPHTRHVNAYKVSDSEITVVFKDTTGTWVKLTGVITPSKRYETETQNTRVTITECSTGRFEQDVIDFDTNTCESLNSNDYEFRENIGLAIKPFHTQTSKT